MNQSQIAMREKPVLKLLISMSVPAVLSMLMQALYNIVDSYWVTKLSVDAFTAVSLAFPLQNAIMAVGVGVGIGIGSLISMCLGAGDREKADRTATVGLVLVFFHCVLFFLAGAFLSGPFLRMFEDDAQILEWSTDYAQIVMCLSFGQLVQMTLEKICQSVGKMKTSMMLMMSGCVMNMILDPILIFGWFGLPAMGVRGAAIATVIGQFFAMFLYIILFLTTKVGVSLHPRHFKWDGRLIRNIYSTGLPAAILLALPSILTGILNGMLSAIDSLYVAVFGLYFKLQLFINLPANGVVQGMRPIISYNFGAGEKERVRKVIRHSLTIVTVIMVLGTVVSLAIPEPILRIFNDDEELLRHGVVALRIMGVSFILSSIGVVAAGVFEALGRGKDSLIVSLLRQLIISVPLAWVLSRFWGVIGVWIALPVAEAIALFYAAFRLKKMGREELA